MRGLRPRLDSWSVARLVAGLVSFLPFVAGVVTGGAFYFRDLTMYCFPTRRFVVEGLLAGEFRHWNPYVNEGVPLVLPFATRWTCYRPSSRTSGDSRCCWRSTSRSPR